MASRLKVLEEAEANMRLLKDEAEARAHTVTEERDAAKLAAHQASSALHTSQEAPEKATQECTQLQQQCADLVLELDSAKKALEAERADHQDTSEALKEAVKVCFDEALKQIQCLNPSFALNLDGYDYRAYVDEGVLVPYHSPEPEEPRTDVEEVAGDEANPESEAIKRTEASGAGTALPS